MNTLRMILARIAGLFAGREHDRELDAELQAHVTMATDENVRRGMPPAEARRRALLDSGGLAAAAESVRDQRGLPWVENLAADLRYAVRALRHSPAFSFVVVLTLGLGIGANTAIFSVVRGVLLKPLPHRDGGRLLYLRHMTDGIGGGDVNFSVPEVRDFRSGVRSFGGIAEYSQSNFALEGMGDPVRVSIGLVTGNFFDVMGLAPVLGRLTRPSDDGPGVPAVMVLTHEFWIKRFGGDSGVVGRTLRIGERPVTVIGVVQPAPYYPDHVDLFTNMVVSPHHLSALMVQNRSHRMTEIIARLAPGATLEHARVEAAAVEAGMRRDHPESYEPGAHYRVELMPFKEAIGENARLTLWLLMGAAAFVLIISAANVVNLTLMRGVRRAHELVVRAALGAGVRRLRRLLLAENLVLALSGAALGLAISTGGVALLRTFAQRYSPRADDIRLDGVVLAFTLGLSVAITLLLSFVAALPKEGNFAPAMSAGGQRVSGGLRKQPLQRAMVIAQIAVSVMLLAGAGLLTRTMIRLSEVPTGLAGGQVLSMDVPIFQLSGTFDSATDASARVKYDEMQREVRALPGVLAVGVGSTMPLRTTEIDFDTKIDGKAPVTGEATPRVEFRTATPGYFRAAGIPLLKGRDFASTDRDTAAKVLIVNQTLANRYFPNEDPIGKRIALTGEILKVSPWNGDWRTIVGVVGDTRDGGLDAPPRPVAFMPFAEEVAVMGGLVIRAGNVEALVKPVIRIVHRIAPETPIENILTVAQIKDESLAPHRLNAELISSFGILAVIIAAVGIAGVLAFSVSTRTNEIGIRMSLGADAARVQRMILREGSVLLGIGLGIGVAGAFAVAGLLRGLLFGIAPRDPSTFAAVAVLMGVVGIVACWIPALRAARIDPAITMRSA